VTRKITRAVAHICQGLQDKVYLGNLDALRDWGFAGDYVKAMWSMLQQDKPDDYVIGTGHSHSVREFAEAAFAHVGRDWRDYVVIDARYLRPAEVDDLRADASKARRVLDFQQLVALMVDADVADLQRRLTGGASAIRTAVERG
jgi:GDPmannose 4,6-dehydratase